MAAKTWLKLPVLTDVVLNNFVIFILKVQVVVNTSFSTIFWQNPAK